MQLQLLAVVAFGFSAFASGDSATLLDFHSITEEDTDDAFAEAVHEEPALEQQLVLNDPGFQMAAIQKSVQPPSQVKAHADLWGVPVKAIQPSSVVTSSGTPMLDYGSHTPSVFEKDVTDLIFGLSKVGSKGKEFGGAIEKIKVMIETSMLPAVESAHSSNQEELDKLHGELHSCYTVRDEAFASATSQKDTYEDTSPEHKTCRKGEAELYQSNVDAHEQWKDLKEIKMLQCHAFSSILDKTGDQKSNEVSMIKAGGENAETYVRRISANVCGMAKGTDGGEDGQGGHQKGGFLDRLLSQKDLCEKATKEFNDQTEKSRELDKEWHEEHLRCNQIQDKMDGAACNYAIEKKDACEAYVECYKSKKQSYLDADATVRQEEISRKEEWIGLKRMHCLIDAFQDFNVTSVEIEYCQREHNTSHLNIEYHTIPNVEDCEVPDLYPSTVAYKAAEFTPLPILAKGRMDANECTGVNEVSETPREGSPSTCNCTRVTLNGPYSAGGMVKCVDCLVIRRSTDMSSCPDGTKLFSPRSREDWVTFLNSADPLRAPNWIIDVTRPEDGCGGCEEFPMNSNNSDQQSWVTSDGSAWWLRNSTYDPSTAQNLDGDYQANCFLDLKEDPEDADSVTFNDQNCDYHSKSYYCQAVQQNLDPKVGSPTGCVCKKVELNGRYSPGMLVKCTNCLDVYRSDDKNSCPLGTKLWSPRTRADWTTFIASATILADPNWIIDVTRPQDGCGGCTDYAMNSGEPEQATWRTADGSPWWLSPIKNFDAPNEGYIANCYLDLGPHPPVNADSVPIFSDGCKYHSKSYYCQPPSSKIDEVVTTTAAPWKSSDVSTVPAPGSPANCTCQLLNLTGDYSAGAILKCTGCLEVEKTTDNSSCPENTKIFAPQTREDWATFFASGGLPPGNGSNFIVDVTSLKNGCGGCTEYAMNSANANQSMWVTSDGAPWWLRSTTYEQPSGDYTANCYLDLKNSTNEDNLELDDGNTGEGKYNSSCIFRATDYYCQPKASHYFSQENLTLAENSEESSAEEAARIEEEESEGNSEDRATLEEEARIQEEESEGNSVVLE